MILSSGTTRTPIGIDIGSRHVRAAQLRVGTGRPRVESLAGFGRTEPGRPLDAEEAIRIRDILSRKGFRGRDIVVTVPRESLCSAIVDLPARAAGVPVDRIARDEFARIFRHNPDEFEMYHWDLPTSARPGKGAQAMAVGCAHADSERQLDLFEQTGLDVRAMDIEAAAVARACRPLLKSSAGITGVLDLGATSARLVILVRETVVYQRILAESGLDGPLAKLAGQLDLSGETLDYLLSRGLLGAASDSSAPQVNADSASAAVEALETYLSSILEELELSFAYARRQYSNETLSGLILTGGGACIPGVDACLATYLKTDVTVASLARLVQCTAPLDEQYGAAVACAVGLALHFEGD